ncbi:MAG: ribosome biogenesis factor YjgA [Burkholderiales bacterium]|nr:ribosome biogenesis factor YjgA [Burkholderiales bacterium]
MEDTPDFDDLPSKSQRKREMTALQDIGAELIELNDQQLAGMELPESLHAAVAEARKLRANGARRRQLQYIGKLMRQVDPAPIREKLDGFRSTSAAETARLHRIERWRERMLGDPAAVAEFIAAHPGTDSQQLRTLIRNTADERARGKPPKHFRALFQMIRSVIDAQSPAGDPAA